MAEDRLLLDTHVLIWSLTAPQRLQPQVREHITRPEAVVFVSAASTWEIAIKVALGRLSALPDDLLDAIADLGFDLLPIHPHHTLGVMDLPMHHRVPFDRLLAAQAQIEKLVLVTADQALQAYAVPVLHA